MKKENKELRTEHKENRKNFMEEEGKAKEAFADLPEEVKTQLKTLGEQRETDLKVVKEKMEDEALTQEEKDNLREEYRAINDEYHNKVKENLADYPDALAYVEAKGELKDKNRVLRDDIRGNRREFKEEKKELISKYRYTYFDQLQVILPKVKTEKLEQISEKIDSMIEKLENNTSMNEDTKDKLMAQYISIQEIIEEELTTRDEDEESIDLDAILDEVSE